MDPMTNPYNEALAATLIDRTIRERIVLVGVTFPGSDDETTEASLDELALLVDTAGADEVGRIVQRRDSPDHTWYIGKGKAEELQRAVPRRRRRHRRVRQRADARPSSSTWRSCSAARRIDRTAVILDIFAQNAHTPGGQGPGRAGPAALPPAPAAARRGRQAVPAARRRRHPLRWRRDQARGRPPADHAAHQQARGRPRRARRHRGRCSARAAAAAGSPHVAIVGYTNAGKSTLLNRLTDAGVLVEDRLFATLDPTTRRLALPGGEPVLLTDTVGFVRKLPHGLVEAFKCTLEVAAEADLLVHVVDASAADPEGQIDAVRDGARRDRRRRRCPSCSCSTRPTSRPDEAKRAASSDHPGSVAISAATGEGIDEFLRTLGDRLRSLTDGRRARRSRTTAATCSPRSTARARSCRSATGDDGMRRSGPAFRRVRRAASESFVAGGAAVGRAVSTDVTAGFVPPPYPYDRLDALDAARPRRSTAGSSTSRSARRATRRRRRWSTRWPTSDTERGYPPSIGIAALREAAPRWIDRRFGVDVPAAAHRRPCVGTKEFVATLPQWLQLRTPDRDTVLYPAVVVPDLRDGRDPRRLPAGAPCPSTPDGRLDLAAIDPDDADAGAVPVGQQPGQPDRRARRPRRRRRLGPGARRAGVLRRVLRRVHLGRAGRARSSSTALDGVVAVHSLSKRSNLAGVRVGFYAGDAELVALPPGGAQARRA